MILVTGGTGFVGKALVRHLTSMGRSVRILLRPSPNSPNLDYGVPVDVAVCSLKDERGLRAAMKGVSTIFHLAGSEREGVRADLTNVDVEGTEVVARVAAEAGIERILFLSHLGADRSSAYSLLRAKAFAEHHIMDSGADFTIFRTAPIFGKDDQFTVPLVNLMKRIPFLFLMPGDGSTLIQPIWIGDLIACMCLALDDPKTVNQVYSIGGAEYLSYKQILDMLMSAVGLRRRLVAFSPAYLRGLSLFFEQFLSKYSLSYYWLDYLSADRTCALDTLPRQFGLMPARLGQKLDYLKEYAKN